MAWTVLANAINFTLSNGGLTALCTGAGATAQSNDIFILGSSNKFYFEINLDTAPDGNSFHGIANAGYVAASSAYGGCLVGSNGTIYVNGASTGINVGSFASGDVLCAAIDLLNQMVWYRNKGGIWNNNGSANPATGVGGVSVAALKFIAPFVRATTAGVQVTANYGASAFTQAVPAGFTAGWSSPGMPTADLISQIGVETWLQGVVGGNQLRLSQIGVEAWFSTNTNVPSSILFTQIGLETFVSTTAKIVPTQARVMILP